MSTLQPFPNFLRRFQVQPKCLVKAIESSVAPSDQSAIETEMPLARLAFAGSAVKGVPGFASETRGAQPRAVARLRAGGVSIVIGRHLTSFAVAFQEVRWYQIIANDTSSPLTFTPFTQHPLRLRQTIDRPSLQGPNRCVSLSKASLFGRTCDSRAAFSTVPQATVSNCAQRVVSGR